MGLPAFKVIISLVALTAIALAALPLAFFAVDGLNGSIQVVSEINGSTAVYTLVYKGRVPLREVNFTLTLLDSKGNDLGSYSASSPHLGRGDNLTLSVPLDVAQRAIEAVVNLRASIGGIYQFNLTAKLPLQGSG